MIEKFHRAVSLRSDQREVFSTVGIGLKSIKRDILLLSRKVVAHPYTKAKAFTINCIDS